MAKYTDKEKDKIKSDFIKRYKETKTISSAVSGLNISRDTVYDWFKQDPEFKQNFDDEKLAVGEGLESKAFQLIDKMVEKGDYGRPVLLITMLNAHLPERYKQSDNTGDDSRQLISEFRKMAKSKQAKTKAEQEAEDIINDSNTK
tara:strand:+ start:163 stop:597 length:435 start_codon:yes stop_codon:yes gene_type:complete